MKNNISIVTPAYNCKDVFLETLNSVLNQTYSFWEWIIVEDHSTDGSYEYIKHLVKNDNRIKLLRTPKNSGAAIARNVGIKEAKGKYIAFIDSDDLWKENKLELQISFMEKNDYAFSYTNYDILYKSGKKKLYKTNKGKETYKSLLKRNTIGCSTVIYNTKIIGKVYMPVDCYKREDHGAWLDITRRGFNGYKLDESLTIYRTGGGGVSSNKFNMVKYQYLVYRKHEKFNFFKSIWYLFVCSVHRIAKHIKLAFTRHL